MLIKLNGVRSAEAALEKANLMWSVEQAPLVTGNGLDITSHKALYRGDNKKVLGVVGQDYEIIQNVTAFFAFSTSLQKDTAPGTNMPASSRTEGRSSFRQNWDSHLRQREETGSTITSPWSPAMMDLPVFVHFLPPSVCSAKISSSGPSKRRRQASRSSIPLM